MIKIQSFNARRAVLYGYELSMVQHVILLRSDPHIHSEFQFSERYNNISFSATMEEPFKCSRFLDIDYSKHPERWDTVCVPMTDAEEDRAYKKAIDLNGRLYDLVGLLSKVSRAEIITPSEEGGWCSEEVTRLLCAGILWIKPALKKLSLGMELTPEELDFLARDWFS